MQMLGKKAKELDIDKDGRGSMPGHLISLCLRAVSPYVNGSATTTPVVPRLEDLPRFEDLLQGTEKQIYHWPW
jgi:hypothetical protein